MNESNRNQWTLGISRFSTRLLIIKLFLKYCIYSKQLVNKDKQIMEKGQMCLQSFGIVLS